MLDNLSIKNKKLHINNQSLTLYFGAAAIIIIFTIACQLAGKRFLTIGNIQNIITQSSVIALIAIGQSFVIITGGIDLSVGSVVGFVGIFSGLLIKSNVPLTVVCLLALISGTIMGLFNGALVSKGKVPAFIVTLGSMQIIRGITMVLNKGKPVSGFPAELSNITNFKIFGMPISILYVFILYIIMDTIITKTKFGKYIYAIGGNEKAAKLSGVKTQKVEMLAYAIGGLFAAVGGIFLLSRLSYADPNAGMGYELDSIAAVVIGGIALSGGKGKLINTLVGALILGSLKCGLQILNVPIYYQKIIIGITIVAAVYFDKAKERKSE